MMSILGWIFVGYVAGNVALWLLPPPSGQSIGGLHVIGFGCVGSVAGGFAYSVIHGNAYSPAGIVWSCIGAAIVVAAWRWLQDGNTGGDATQ